MNTWFLPMINEYYLKVYKTSKELVSKRVKNYSPVFESFIFSTVLIYVSSGLRVINPKYSDWLSFGDGTAEISWEFFRNQPLFQFPLGLNPQYGLEVSSTAAFDGQIPIMSFVLHPFANLLPGRFQYYGLFIFFTFALNYYFAKKIFQYLEFNRYHSTISGILLATSPVILNRFIENTHYSLTSAWIIFAAILLSLQRNIKFVSWIFVISFSILIHLYLLPFVIIIFLFTLFFEINNKMVKIDYIFVIAALTAISILLMSVTGYFFGGISGKDVGYGLFRSTLLSLIDSSGWSKLLPDIPEPDGAYEGFAFIGTATIILLFINLILINKVKNAKASLNFNPIWISTIILFLFSLSNKIAIGKLEIFTFPIPNFISFITNTFRSSGRFSWLLVFVLFIYAVYSLRLKLSDKTFSILLTSVLLLHIVDIRPQLISQKSTKFQTSFDSDLKNMAWQSISQCYKKLRVYPPTVGVDNYYAFLNIAYKQNLGINTGRFSRVNQNTILGAYDLMHKEFNTGIYRTDSFYVFTNAEFVLPEIVDYHKNLAIHTLNDDSAYGELNGYAFIAPNLQNCPEGSSLKTAAKGFGAPETQKYRGERLIFGNNLDTSKYVLIGFSALEDWGVWSVDEVSKINFNTDDLYKFNSININARDLASPANEFSVSLNDSKIGTCYFSTKFTTCSLPFNFKSLKTNIITLSFVPKIIRSPKDLGLSEDTRNLGFGMNSISFS
jgi:hypothetical protein